MYRQRRHAAYEGRGDVRPSALRRHPDVAPQVLEAPFHVFGHYRRSAEQDAVHLRHVVELVRADAGLHLSVEESRARAEERHARFRRKFPQTLGFWRHRVAVIEHHGRARDETRQQDVPHHPARRREIEHAGRGLQVEMEMRELQRFQQHAAMPVHKGFRQPRRAGRIDDPERVVEPRILEGEILYGRTA